MVVFSLLISFSVPAFIYLPPFSYYLKKCDNVTKMVLDWIENLIKEHEKTFDENHIRDFIDAFLLEKKKGIDPYFKDSQLISYLHDLFLAGTDTSASTLYWSLLCFIHYPETQSKLREEIHRVFGTSGVVSTSKKDDMPYTNAFIQELYRFRTMVPLGLMRHTTEDTVLEGYHLPKGTIIQSNIWAVHNDPKLWKNPEKFKPGRFLDENGKFVKSKYVIPFSMGPRSCLGEQVARMEVFILLVGMVQKFEFLPDPNANELPSIEDGVFGPSVVPRPFKVVAREI